MTNLKGLFEGIFSNLQGRTRKSGRGVTLNWKRNSLLHWPTSFLAYFALCSLRVRVASSHRVQSPAEAFFFLSADPPLYSWFAC